MRADRPTLAIVAHDRIRHMTSNEIRDKAREYNQLGGSALPIERKPVRWF
jgi:hypothetical protein